MTKNKVSTHSTLVKESLSFQRTPLVKLLRLSFILSLVNIVVVLLIKNFLPPQIPLYYGLAEGQEQLSGTLGLVVPGILSLSLTSVNTIIMFFVKDNFIKQTLIISSLVVTIFATITTLKIILLVGSF
ncbi:hypothetical protein A2955_04860 [Candidatus Woesebacteria bacterium RIFCSPLOWO2_01_FULL_37_19]|uniref:DUF1648 domain-containing protein n=2 Tax=Candidatus Woeseibacteriota TaxID=1752722 RepID=A0A1F8B6R5_9BACT|nr:MAG: hypothetical protein A2771_02450 [Candidatus Woesebacteria bacterium RIFCSPHIGHO2_01_FULL_38_26b]OGM59630.1 MAG: hypothetical protein A2955_04860 [Candidatus Woesebacteria bacterium RIFCSPLOWO2_01_FULL_37_19]